MNDLQNLFGDTGLIILFFALAIIAVIIAGFKWLIEQWRRFWLRRELKKLQFTYDYLLYMKLIKKVLKYNFMDIKRELDELYEKNRKSGCWLL